MNYARLLSPCHVAALHDWLLETGELYVHVGSYYDRATANSYFIAQIGQLKTLLSSQSPASSFEIYIFRKRQYPVRGIANQSMADQVWRNLRYGRWYTIVSIETYPKPIYYLAAGKDYSALKRDIAELEGRMIAIGSEPVAGDYDGRSMFTEPVDVMYFSAGANVESYEEYTENPSRYKHIVDSWEDPSFS
jgi:hypothetical protein